MAPGKVIFVTGNANKLAEVRDILGDTIDIEGVKLEIPELQGTINDIVIDKCIRAAVLLQKPVLVEDTSLSFTAMGELPGPYIKWFFEELGNENLHRMLAGFEDKSACISVSFAYSEGPKHNPVIFQAKTYGKIVPPRGPATFGWNPSFEYEGRTFAEMTKEEKYKISGRPRALAEFQAWLGNRS